MPRLTPQEKKAELDKVFGDGWESPKYGWQEEGDLRFSAEEQEGIQEGEKEEQGQEEGQEEIKEAPQKEPVTTPPAAKEEDYSWAYAARAEADLYAKRIAEQEARIQQLERERIAPKQEALSSAAADADDENYFATTEQVNARLKDIEQKQQQYYQSHYQIAASAALRQERAAFSRDLEKLVSEYKDLYEVIPKERVEQVWAEYEKNPSALHSNMTPGGFGLPWYDEFSKAYKTMSHSKLEQRIVELEKKLGAQDKKREERKKEDNSNLAKISRGGSAYQEFNVSKTEPRKWRDYKSLRPQALQVINSGE